MELTESQLAAIHSLDSDVAISAGAGSGKTTVVALRFAEALKATTGRPPVAEDVDRMLTITFTKKAAGEIAERVRRVVQKEIGPKVARRVDEAWISTFHTMCGRLVRRHALETGAEPGFRTSDETQAHLLQVESFDAAVTGLIDSDSDVTALLNSYRLEPLRAGVIRLYDRIRNLGLDPQLAVAPSGWDARHDLMPEVRRTGQEYLVALDGCKDTDALRTRRERFSAHVEAVAACTLDEPDSAEAICAVVESYSLSAWSGLVDLHDEFKQAQQQLRRAALGAIGEPLFVGLTRLLRRFDTEYRSRKASEGVLDFDDLQEYAVALLARPSIAARYREQFALITVDEFQDTNDLQMRVLEPLRHDNVTIVGDERQSIYRFRDADVEIFRRERRHMGASAQHELCENFRSHRDILGFVNEGFSRPFMFGPEFMRLEASRKEGRDIGVPSAATRVRVVLVDGSDAPVAAAREAEAAEVARQIRELIDGGCDAGSIAVLLRGAANADVFADALAVQDVPVYVSAGASLFDAVETQEMLALIRAIALPEDDAALALVLGGRLCGLSDNGLLALRLAGPHESLWAALTKLGQGAHDAPRLDECDAGIALHAYAALCDLRVLHGSAGLGELVRTAVEAFDYDVTLATLPARADRALANVNKIIRLAEEYEHLEAADAGLLWRRLREREDGASSERSAAVQTSGGGAVRVMTIHSAKGLEFPVVFVADLASEVSHPEAQFIVGKGRDLEGRVVPSIGVTLPQDEQFEGARTLEHSRLAEEARAASIAEEQRVLYVACTRAEELLVLSGAAKLSSEPKDKHLIDWVRQMLGDPDASGTVRLGDADIAVTVCPPAAEEIEPAVIEWRDSSAQTCVPPGVAPREAQARTVPKHLSYSALHEWDTCRLSFYARRMLGMREQRGTEGSGSSATEFGSAFHEVMRVTPPEGPTAEMVEAAARRHGLSGDDAVRLGRVATALVGTPLLRRALAAPGLHRELPLRVPLAAGRSLVGAIDLLAWEGDRALVVDYKTGRPPGASAQDRTAAYRLQAECYALAALRAGASGARVVFTFVEAAEEIEYEFGSDAADVILRDIDERLEAMSSGEITHLERFESSACARCPALGGICPIDDPGA